MAAKAGLLENHCSPSESHPSRQLKIRVNLSAEPWFAAVPPSPDGIAMCQSVVLTATERKGQQP